MNDWKRLRDEILAEDPETRAEYEALGPTYSAIADLIRLRLLRGLTQEELAQRMGKQQSAIARMEGGRVKPSIAFLEEAAKALGARLVVRLEEAELASRPGQERAAS